MPRTVASFTLALLLSLAVIAPVARAQPVLEGTEDLSFDRTESWAMKYFTSVSLLTAMGSPRELEPGAVELALEGGWIPSLSESERRVGFDGLKVEDLNKTSIFGRPRITVGLPNKISLTAAYVPPIDVGGAEPNLLAIAIGRPLWQLTSWRIGGRLYAQFGDIEGDFTCDEATVAAGADPVRNPFRCTKVSEDEVAQEYLGFEVSAARSSSSGRIEPHFALSVNRLDTEFRVNAEYFGFIDRKRLRADGYTWAATAGVSLALAGGWRLTGEAFYTPLDVVRPPAGGSQNDPLFNVRGMISYRLR